jgi:enediyne biosynthesis protein E4
MLPQQTGIKFENRLIESPQNNIITYEYFYNGGGVAAGDFNNDGWIDLYFTSNMGENKMYLNNKDFTFTDITKSAGVLGRKGWKTGVSVADVNGDGLLDIYVCYSGDVEPKLRTNQLFINNGNLTFTEKAKEFGVDDTGHSTHAAFFDFDRDGDLDLYVLNHNVKQFRNFDAAYVKKIVDPDAGDRLYENVNGRFVDITQKAGIKSNPLGYGLGLNISDFNNDGWPDIYVSNDYVEEDYLYINNQNGSFTESLKSMIGHISNFSMGIDAADINNDGLIDIFTLDMLPEDNKRQKLLFAPDNFEVYNNMVDNGFYHQSMRNMLQLNNGNGTFSEIGQLAGVSNTDWSWSALFADFDNDGQKDLFVTNGYGRDMINRDFMKFYADERTKHLQGKTDDKMFKLLQTITSTPLQNYIYKNNGDFTFTNKVIDWGIEGSDFSHGAVYVDLDNDGDLDLVTNRMNDFAGVFRNNSRETSKGNFIQFTLKIASKNTNAIGAKITVHTPKGIIHKENFAVHGFQSSMAIPIHLGLPTSQIDSVIIQWPDGQMQVSFDLKPNLHHSIQYAPNRESVKVARKAETIFNSEVQKLPFKHEELLVNDFKVQPLMPNMVSYHGPKLAKADINGDRLEDVFMPGPEGKSGKIMIQNQDGTFTISKQQALDEDANYEDTFGLFFDADADGDQDLWVVSGGFGEENSGLPLEDRLYINIEGTFYRKETNIPKNQFSGSVAVAWDFDTDGDLDVFVGGRVTQGNYPMSPGSKLYENQGNGKFMDVTKEKGAIFENNEMITHAVLANIGTSDQSSLITCGEWTSIKTYQYINGKIIETTNQYFDEQPSGWWNTLQLVDIDGDGDLDIIAGNWGLNSQFKPSSSEPMELFYDDFDKNGYIDPLLCYYIQGRSWPAASRDEITDQIVALRKKYVTYTSYADQSLSEILPHLDLKQINKKEVNTLTTMWFEYKDGKFIQRTLPLEANFSPVYSIYTDDFNGDGIMDILLGGNIEYTRIRIGKNDANYGTLLLGKGGGKFEYIPQNESGLNIRGCVRSFLPIKNNGGQIKILVGLNNDFPQLLEPNSKIIKQKN